MKYLHSGYILFCDRAEHADDGRINAMGLFDLCSGKNMPLRMRCDCIIGFGTPYERRQYKGILTIEGPDGQELVNHEFSANDPNHLFKGHYIFPLDLNFTQEGNYTARVILSNWKNENVWEVSRQFWAMVVQEDAVPDP
jgi:hypothetical protein